MWEALSEPFRYPRPLGKDAAAPGSSQSGKRAKAKAKDWQGTLRRIWQYLAHRKGRLTLVLLMVIASSGLTLLGPYLIGMAIDDYLEGPGGRPWLLFLLGLACVYVLQSVVGWLQNIWMIQIAQEAVFRMRTDLFEQLHRLPIPFFGKRRQGDLMSRMTNDIDSVSSTLNSSAIQLFSSVLMLGGTIVVMLLLSPLLTLLTFLVVPLMALGMRWITRRTGALFKERQRNLGELNGFVEETLSGQRIIKAFSQEERVIHEFRKRNERIKQSGFWAQTISGFIPKLMNGLNNLSFAIIACVGGVLAIRGAITVGVIIVFVEYARQFTRPLNDLANQWNTLLSAIAGAERVFEVLDEEKEDVDESSAVSLDTVSGAVVFQEVSFSYEEGGETLKQISFEAKPGETIAIIGPTGAGKTSLIQLLSRFYDADGGKITLDGRDIQSIRRESLRSHMAFVLQDSFLFEGTIRDNIRYGKLDATDEQVEEAAKLANAHSFIMRLSGGYDRLLIADGSGISQGQRQLLAIARAILADPAILVLDEATSSIDTVSEIKIQEGLKRLMEGRTSFVIAHRLNTIREADRILVLKDGRLVEQGPHEELLSQEGLYSELFHGQLEQ
ncbi:ABC transporter ATP-binding protein [Paenibacillus nasutitermitis]|uniref:ABC transporter ATP-binding protein YfiC n=1 Tax=Paenibacillus nasutitermitis TaxID=1652958 RepID=A0A916ZI77_9BACL|nr:ABC transporter ATP-binding protein [Paenibacillus nasutitermitis]GGD97816.1 putative ABC transporter ATP-binding protein YfiC [Paenibacillus nasutitermitis]